MGYGDRGVGISIHISGYYILYQTYDISIIKKDNIGI